MQGHQVVVDRPQRVVKIKRDSRVESLPLIGIGAGDQEHTSCLSAGVPVFCKLDPYDVFETFQDLPDVVGLIEDTPTPFTDADRRHELLLTLQLSRSVTIRIDAVELVSERMPDRNR